MTRWVLATANPHKVAELAGMFAGLDVELVPKPADVALPEETGRTFLANARLKARAVALATGEVALADDSGLEVDALGGAPGLHSARYLAKPGATDADRRRYLLESLQDKPRPWLARFRAAVAIAIPGGSVQVLEGQCPGEIIPEERGTSGFGYDPIFFIPELGRTMAELGMEEKNRISHRARAAMKARPILDMLFADQR
jgi:XTP/dITP diphosphohydrolase